MEQSTVVLLSYQCESVTLQCSAVLEISKKKFYKYLDTKKVYLKICEKSFVTRTLFIKNLQVS